MGKKSKPASAPKKRPHKSGDSSSDALATFKPLIIQGALLGLQYGLGRLFSSKPEKKTKK